MPFLIRFFCAVAAVLCIFPVAARAQVHRSIVVLVPAYEGSALFEPHPLQGGKKPRCVWVSLDAMRHKELYYSLRMPNPLVPRPLLNTDPVDVYDSFIREMTGPGELAPDVSRCQLGRDFFYFAYDWRQDIATVTAPQLALALEQYARTWSVYSGRSPQEAQFIIVAHSMGGLVARTMLNLKPHLASRLRRLYLVGTPNLGAVKAIKTLLVGPGALKEADVSFPFSLIKLLPTSVNAQTTRLVAISRPSLYELLPIGDLQWEHRDTDARSFRISPDDLLTVGVWKPFWPTAEAERRDFLESILPKLMEKPGKPADPKAWEFCQDNQYTNLQRILSLVRNWRARLGTLQDLAELLSRGGADSRLRVVAGRGIKTPTGIITEGAHDSITYRYTYAPGSDGDETVTVESALGDLKKPELITYIDGCTHGKLVRHAEFIQLLSRDIVAMEAMPLEPAAEPVPTVP
jgi:pimeloyl-ACP methyl ester carboxylesterase